MDKKRWFTFSLAQQLGHIGSEISRARHWEKKGEKKYHIKSLERALNLIDLTLNDRRWITGIKELARFREVMSSWYCQQKIYDISSENLQNYCTNFTRLENKVL